MHAPGDPPNLAPSALGVQEIGLYFNTSKLRVFYTLHCTHSQWHFVSVSVFRHSVCQAPVGNNSSLFCFPKPIIKSRFVGVEIRNNNNSLQFSEEFGLFVSLFVFSAFYFPSKGFILHLVNLWLEFLGKLPEVATDFRERQEKQLSLRSSMICVVKPVYSVQAYTFFIILHGTGICLETELFFLISNEKVIKRNSSRGKRRQAMHGIEFVCYAGYKLRLVALSYVFLKLIPRPSPKTGSVP